MERVLVIGSGGAGKSTFALALGRRTGLPVVHLDREYWRPGWIEPPKETWEAQVRDLIARPRWIHDGNYGGTLDLRLAAADTCVLLDLPRTTCLARVVRRRLALRGRVRADVTEGCPERLTRDFVRWIWTYQRRRRPGILAKLADFERRGGRAVVLRSAAEVRAFLEGVAAPPAARADPAPPGQSSRSRRDSTTASSSGSGPSTGHSSQ